MKKKILAILIAVSLLGVGLFAVVPALADSSNPLDHISLTPASVMVAPGGTQQFTMQAFDSGNAAITSHVNYFWLVTDGGTIGTTGLFTAGTVTGTYTNAVEVVAVQGSITRTAFATVIVSGTPGALTHVTVTPASATVVISGMQQFTAQGYDENNIAIAGLTYSWSVVSGGGTITSVTNNTATATFTAGTTTGTYTNTVQVTATQGTPVSGYASVVVSATPTTTTTTTPGVKIPKFLGMFKGLLNTANFPNFLGGQFQVVEGGITHTIVVTPGVVQTASGTSLTIIPNGQTSTVTYTLTAGTSIIPKDTQLASGDKVVVVTDNNQVTSVVKITVASTNTNLMPPGLRDKDNGHNGKGTPPGWSHGKKVGWGMMNSQDDGSGDD